MSLAAVSLPTAVTLPALVLALLGVFVLAALALLAWRRWRPGRRLRAAPSVEALDTLAGWAPEATRVMTLPQLRARAVLGDALPPRHLVLAQVSLARFIKVPTRNSYAEWLRRVGHLSADLVVCDAHSQVVAVVEIRSLRTRASDRADRRQQRFARVLRAAGIPLHVWVENTIPTVDEVRRLFAPKPSLLESAQALAVPPATASPAATPDPTTPPPPPAAASRDGGDFANTHPPADEVIEMREPPSSTWFDDFDSGPTPLDAARRRRAPGTPPPR